MTPLIPAIILSAGRSTRMGRAKATLPIGGGDMFLTRLVKTFAAAGVDDVIVVLGHEADAIASRVAKDFSHALQPRIVVNTEYDRGQLSSLQAGLALADRPGVAAILMTLVDVPLVAPATVRAVVERYRATRAPIVRPVSGDRHGHPILIDRSLFDALRRASDDTGAKPVVRAYASVSGDVPVTDEGAFRDIDTAEEYERVIRAQDDAALPSDSSAR